MPIAGASIRAIALASVPSEVLTLDRKRSPATWGNRKILVLGISGVVLLLLAAMLYFLNMPARTDLEPLPPLSAEETRIRDRLAAHVSMLAGTIGQRNIWHYDALMAAADYIEHELAELGYQVSREPLVSRGKAVHNIIAERGGEPDGAEIVLIGAHYDTVFGSPGANDNGSGVAAMLELARLISEQGLGRRLRFAAFVNEEAPFSRSPEMGSLVSARAAKGRGERIAAMLSLETVGHYSDQPGSQQYPFPLNHLYPDTADFIGFVGNLKSSVLVRRSLRSFRRHTRFPAQGAAVPAWITGVGWSDHWSFWQAGYRAIMVTDTAFFRYGHYHTAEDTPDRINYERMARMVAGLSGVIRDLATTDAQTP